MPKITSIKLNNVQSHKDTHLPLGSGVNAVVGTTHSGKSAVIRGLKWAFFNKPSTGFASDWSNETCVNVGLDDGRTIVRKRTSRVNEYAITGPEDNQTFSAVGSDVPDAVTELMPLYDFNWQDQQNGHYLLSDTGGQVARRLNEVAALDKVDDVLANANKLKRDASAAVKTNEEALDAAQAHAQQFDFVEDIEALSHKATKQQERVDSVVEHHSRISSWLEALQTHRSQLDKLCIDDAERRLNEAQQAEEQQRELSEQSASLQAKCNELSEKQKEHDYSADCDRAVELVQNAREQCDLLEGANTTLESLKKFIELNQTLRQKDEQLQELEDTFRAEFPEQCPLCGSSNYEL